MKKKKEENKKIKKKKIKKTKPAIASFNAIFFD